MFYKCLNLQSHLPSSAHGLPYFPGPRIPQQTHFSIRSPEAPRLVPCWNGLEIQPVGFQ